MEEEESLKKERCSTYDKLYKDFLISVCAYQRKRVLFLSEINNYKKDEEYGEKYHMDVNWENYSEENPMFAKQYRLNGNKKINLQESRMYE